MIVHGVPFKCPYCNKDMCDCSTPFMMKHMARCETRSVQYEYKARSRGRPPSHHRLRRFAALKVLFSLYAPLLVVAYLRSSFSGRGFGFLFTVYWFCECSFDCPSITINPTLYCFSIYPCNFCPFSNWTCRVLACKDAFMVRYFSISDFTPCLYYCFL